MIHINLLPVRRKRGEEANRNQLILFALALVIAVGANYWQYSRMDNAAEQRRQQINRTKQEIAQLDKVIGEVKDITQRKKDLEDKLGVLNNLKKNRSGPVKMMDAIQTALPKKVWVAALGENGGAMTITGSAFSHDDLAEFMSALDNVVDTPLGIGRIVEGGSGAEGNKTSRVELAADGQVKEFKLDEVHRFFTNVQLRGASEQGMASFKIVNFNLTCTADYTA